MNEKNKKIVLLALFTAIVVILQLLGSFIKFGPFSISLVLVPIVVGAAILGPLAGGWLGLAFGAVVLISGDAALFLGVNPWATVFVVLLKGMLAGLAAGAVYKLLEKKNIIFAAICAAIVCPVVNTGIFLIGCYLFFMETIESLAHDNGFDSVVKFMFIGLVGGNFLFEVAFNIILSPVIVRIIKIGQKNKI